jgi:hypothetical protein
MANIHTDYVPAIRPGMGMKKPGFLGRVVIAGFTVF